MVADFWLLLSNFLKNNKFMKVVFFLKKEKINILKREQKKVDISTVRDFFLKIKKYEKNSMVNTYF